MKHYYKLIAAMATAAAASSCASHEDIDLNPGNEISFRAAVDNASRASETTQANFNRFEITAVCPTNTGEGFTDHFSLSNNTWLPITQHYWPKGNEEMKFYCWSPQSVNSGVSIDAGNQSIADFQPADKIDEQVDLITAFQSGTKSGAGSKSLQLTFRHALTQIEIQAKNTKTVYKYLVKGFRIGCVTSKGTFTFPQSKDEWGSWILSADDADKGDYAAEFDTPIELVTDPASITTQAIGTAMILPQSFNAWSVIDPAIEGQAFTMDRTNTGKGAFLAVLINITATVDNNQLYPDRDTNLGGYAWACIPVSGKWEHGKKYIYILDFSDGAGKFPPEDPVRGGDDILTDPIRFSVLVEPWETQNGINTPM